ncbi:hypothetical protein KP509_07G001400 [Ceratopteris richardii]|uniref:Uncharacterized protein n=1 Tax=Ceratopteris richardii TaxID=49495 RepID=A0A8T2U816_CERRI|nr:hypothetical protein KP509_07G001400 [Ceratopteris richardii]
MRFNSSTPRATQSQDYSGVLLSKARCKYHGDWKQREEIERDANTRVLAALCGINLLFVQMNRDDSIKEDGFSKKADRKGKSQRTWDDVGG